MKVITLYGRRDEVVTSMRTEMDWSIQGNWLVTTSPEQGTAIAHRIPDSVLRIEVTDL